MVNCIGTFEGNNVKNVCRVVRKLQQQSFNLIHQLNFRESTL